MGHSPLWISHRGLWKQTLENTEQAFDLAVESGFRCLETDLRLTKDKHLVLCHDLSFGRLGGPSQSVSEQTREELERVELAGGYKVMFFDQFVKKYAQCRWVFDIKAEQGAEVLGLLNDYIRSVSDPESLVEKIIFLFWNAKHQRSFKSLQPKATFFAMRSNCWQAGIANFLGLPALSGIDSSLIYAVPPLLGPFEVYVPRIIRAYKNKGARMVAYLPESEKHTWKALDLGMDMVITNHPIVGGKF